MNSECEARLNALRTDFEEVFGRPFSHFYCPILYRDEDVDLCKAHIINRAFPDVGRQWTVQRADVDNFYGRCFESDFVNIQHLSGAAAGSIVNKDLPVTFRADILRNGVPIPYYFASSAKTPSDHTNIRLETENGIAELRLKLSPQEVMATNDSDWEIRLEKDLRLPALVSLLKSAHLTLFRMLGYRYALSAGGHFMGKEILGSFFLNNHRHDKAAVLQNAARHFAEFSSMVRPVSADNHEVPATTENNECYLCETSSGVRWAFMAFIRTTDATHAVVVPIFEHQDGVSRFMTFMRTNGAELEARHCLFEDQVFKVSPRTRRFCWPIGRFKD